MRGGLCGKLHGKRSQLLFALAVSRSDSQIFVENDDFRLRHLHSTPPLDDSRRNCCHDVWYGKLEWFDYPMFKQFEDTFIRFDRIHERVGQTNGRTDIA